MADKITRLNGKRTTIVTESVNRQQPAIGQKVVSRKFISSQKQSYKWNPSPKRGCKEKVTRYALLNNITYTKKTLSQAKLVVRKREDGALPGGANKTVLHSVFPITENVTMNFGP